MPGPADFLGRKFSTAGDTAFEKCCIINFSSTAFDPAEPFLSTGWAFAFELIGLWAYPTPWADGHKHRLWLSGRVWPEMRREGHGWARRSGVAAFGNGSPTNRIATLTGSSLHSRIGLAFVLARGSLLIASIRDGGLSPLPHVLIFLRPAKRLWQLRISGRDYPHTSLPRRSGRTDRLGTRSAGREARPISGCSWMR